MQGSPLTSDILEERGWDNEKWGRIGARKISYLRFPGKFFEVVVCLELFPLLLVWEDPGDFEVKPGDFVLVSCGRRCRGRVGLVVHVMSWMG